MKYTLLIVLALYSFVTFAQDEVCLANFEDIMPLKTIALNEGSRCEIVDNPFKDEINGTDKVLKFYKKNQKYSPVFFDIPPMSAQNIMEINFLIRGERDITSIYGRSIDDDLIEINGHRLEHLYRVHVKDTLLQGWHKIAITLNNPYCIHEILDDVHIFPDMMSNEAGVYYIDEINYVTYPEGVAAKNVEVDEKSKTMLRGTKHRVYVKIDPMNASNKKVKWSSENEKIASVDCLGMVTALSVGKTVITVETQDGGFTDNIEVEVINDQIPETVIMDAEKVKVNTKPSGLDWYLNTSSEAVHQIVANPNSSETNSSSKVLKGEKQNLKWTSFNFLNEAGILVNNDMKGIEFKTMGRDLNMLMITMLLKTDDGDEVIRLGGLKFEPTAPKGEWDSVFVPFDEMAYGKYLTHLRFFPDPESDKAQTIFIDNIKFAYK